MKKYKIFGSSSKETLKKNDIHELKLFNAMIQSKDKKYEEAMNYLIHFKSELIDKPMVYDMIVQNAIKAKNKVLKILAHNVIIVNGD